jgi:hypothetical protein
MRRAVTSLPPRGSGVHRSERPAAARRKSRSPLSLRPRRGHEPVRPDRRSARLRPRVVALLGSAGVRGAPRAGSHSASGRRPRGLRRRLSDRARASWNRRFRDGMVASGSEGLAVPGTTTRPTPPGSGERGRRRPPAPAPRCACSSRRRRRGATRSCGGSPLRRRLPSHLLLDGGGWWWRTPACGRSSTGANRAVHRLAVHGETTGRIESPTRTTNARLTDRRCGDSTRSSSTGIRGSGPESGDPRRGVCAERRHGVRLWRGPAPAPLCSWGRRKSSRIARRGPEPPDPRRLAGVELRLRRTPAVRLIWGAWRPASYFWKAPPQVGPRSPRPCRPSAAPSCRRRRTGWRAGSPEMSNAFMNVAGRP